MTTSVVNSSLSGSGTDGSRRRDSFSGWADHSTSHVVRHQMRHVGGALVEDDGSGSSMTLARQSDDAGSEVLKENVALTHVWEDERDRRQP
jgi:hypothetical protein